MPETDGVSDESGEQEREQRSWTKLSPPVAVTGTFDDIVTSSTIDSNVQDTGTDFGVLLSDPRADEGTVWVNDAHESGGIVETDDDAPRPVDFRVIGDESGQTIISGTLASDEEGPNEYSEGEFDVDETMVWVGGVAGQYVGRALDRHGTPYARTWSDDGDSGVVTGLIQVPEGWRFAEHDDDADMSAIRSDLVGEGLKPRVARPAYPREDLRGEEITLALRQSSGRSYIGNVFRTADVPDDGLFDDDGGIRDEAWDAAVDPTYDEDFESFIAENDVPITIYTGDGFTDDLDSWPDFGSSDSGGMDIEADNGTSESSASSQRQEFVDGIVDALPEGMSPCGADGNPAAFNDDLQTVAETQGGLQLDEGETEEVREAIYDRTAWLDASDLS
jgi:hypothetical protein